MKYSFPQVRLIEKALISLRLNFIVETINFFKTKKNLKKFFLIVSKHFKLLDFNLKNYTGERSLGYPLFMFFAFGINNSKTAVSLAEAAAITGVFPSLSALFTSTPFAKKY